MVVVCGVLVMSADAAALLEWNTHCPGAVAALQLAAAALDAVSHEANSDKSARDESGDCKTVYLMEQYCAGSAMSNITITCMAACCI